MKNNQKNFIMLTIKLKIQEFVGFFFQTTIDINNRYFTKQMKEKIFKFFFLNQLLIGNVESDNGIIFSSLISDGRK